MNVALETDVRRAGSLRSCGGSETKNDESRFGLTRAPFSGGAVVWSEAKVSLDIAPLRADRNAPQDKRLFLSLTENSTRQLIALAALALIYGSAVMAVVIVTLAKSGRRRAREVRNKN